MDFSIDRLLFVTLNILPSLADYEPAVFNHVMDMLTPSSQAPSDAPTDVKLCIDSLIELNNLIPDRNLRMDTLRDLLPRYILGFSSELIDMDLTTPELARLLSLLALYLRPSQFADPQPVFNLFTRVADMYARKFVEDAPCTSHSVAPTEIYLTPPEFARLLSLLAPFLRSSGYADTQLLFTLIRRITDAITRKFTLIRRIADAMCRKWQQEVAADVPTDIQMIPPEFPRPWVGATARSPLDAPIDIDLIPPDFARLVSIFTPRFVSSQSADTQLLLKLFSRTADAIAGKFVGDASSRSVSNAPTDMDLTTPEYEQLLSLVSPYFCSLVIADGRLLSKLICRSKDAKFEDVLEGTSSRSHLEAGVTSSKLTDETEIAAVADLFAFHPGVSRSQLFASRSQLFASDMGWADIGGAEEGATARAKFVEEARFTPPRFLRVIDCELSVREQAVVIIDYDVHQEAGSCNSASTRIGGYTAISHTYGQDVYAVFDCACAADCRASVPRADPAKSPCQQVHADEDPYPEMQQRVIADVLGMCRLLVDTGLRYAWHDGVCIAQHDAEEVEHFIQHIAWIYANANDTVIFLHYIGRPMAPIAPSFYEDGLISRWQTRVWTFQEAALSKRRRYCVRRGQSLGDFGKDLEHGLALESGLASWYDPNAPNYTAIIDEPQFISLLREILPIVGPFDDSNLTRRQKEIKVEWANCLSAWLHLLWSLRSSFPTIVQALESCSSRESKHEGDRINSILGLAGVKDFSAPKDYRVEESTMEFFKRMGKDGLAIALFTTNRFANAQNGRAHTWYPTLCSQLWFNPIHFYSSASPRYHTDHLEFEVRSEDDDLEVRGLLACVSLQVTIGNIRDAVSFGAEARAAVTDSLSAFEDESLFVYGVEFGKGSFVWHEKDNLVLLFGTAVRPSFAINDLIYRYGRDAASSVAAFDEFEHWRRSDLQHKREIAERFSRKVLAATMGWSSGADADEFHCTYTLIFPAQVLECVDFTADAKDFAFSKDGITLDAAFSNWHEFVSRPPGGFLAVMVRGDVKGVVEKTGYFLATPMLLNVLLEHPDYLTFLDKLVIK